jgi:hypothetical protein
MGKAERRQPSGFRDQEITFSGGMPPEKVISCFFRKVFAV